MGGGTIHITSSEKQKARLSKDFRTNNTIYSTAQETLFGTGIAHVYLPGRTYLSVSAPEFQRSNANQSEANGTKNVYISKVTRLTTGQHRRKDYSI